MVIFNNWETNKEWHLIEISFKIEEEDFDNFLFITLAFFGVGVVFGINL